MKGRYLPTKLAWAILWTLLILCPGALVYCLLAPSADRTRLFRFFDPVHVRHWSFDDVSAQTWAFRTALVTAMTLFGVLAWRSAPELPRSPFRSLLPQSRMEVLVGFVACLGLAYFLAWTAPHGDWSPLLALGIFGAVPALLHRTRSVGEVPWATGLLSVVAVGIVLPAFFLSAGYYAASLDWQVMEHEFHYAQVMTGGERLAEGRALGKEVVPYYGLVWPLLMGFITRCGGASSWTFHFHVIAACMLVFNTAMVTLIFRVSRNWLLTLLSLPFILSWNHFADWSFNLPNQSAFRYLGVPLVLWTLWKNRADHSLRADCLVIGSAVLAAFWNPETGVALLAGAWVFLLAARRSVSWKGILVLTLRFAAFGAAGILLACLAGVGISGRWPDAVGFAATYLPTVLQGGFGLHSYWEPAVLVVGGGSLIQLMLSARKFRTLSPRERFLMACATTGVVWLIYWFNRSHWMSLKVSLVLFLFIAMENLRWARIAIRRALRNKPIPALAWVFTALLIGGLVPISGTYAVQAVGRVQEVWALRRSAAFSRSVNVSGVLLPAPIAESILAEAEEIRRHRASVPDEPLLLFTEHPVLVPKLLNKGIDLPFADVFGESFGLRRRGSLLDSIRKSPARFLLVTRFDPKAAGYVASHKAYFEGLLQDLSTTFILEQTHQRILVYRRVP